MYILSTLENNKFDNIRNISESNYEDLVTDSKFIKNCHSQFVVFKYLQSNIGEYSKFLEKISNLSVNQINATAMFDPKLVSETNRIIMNLVTSFRFFLDNADTYLSRNFGKNSDQFSDFKKLKSSEFDDHFAYRFLYKLRDYCIHLGFPINGLHFQAEKNTQNPEKMIGDLIISIDRDLLLKEKKKHWGAIVYKDLQNIDDDIDLRPHIQVLSKSILRLQKFIYDLQKEELEDRIDNIELFCGGIKNENNIIGIRHNYKENGQIVNFEFYRIPFDKITDFKTYKNSC